MAFQWVARSEKVPATKPSRSASTGCSLPHGKHRVTAIVRRAATEPGRPAEPRSRQGHSLLVAAELARRHRGRRGDEKVPATKNR